MYIIHYSQTHETIRFAAEELQRLMQQVGDDAFIHYQKEWDNSHEPMERIHLLTTDEYDKLNSLHSLSIQDDGFAIVRDSDGTWIIGNEPRSVLYGVYTYAKQQFGYRFIMLNAEDRGVPEQSSYENPYIHTPMFTRRGNVIETIKDPDYINALIDWGVKNGQNEYFFTFFLWDELKPFLTSALKKRGVHVTLGGHSLSYLLRDLMLTESAIPSHDEKNLTFFSPQSPLQKKVIERIVTICQENEVVTRISLWPEDIGVDRKTSEDFLSNYIRFTEKLREALADNQLSVEVEYIVYNAGLAWIMLEREQTAVSGQVDALYAYWGRDYSTGIEVNEENQRRATQALKDWHTSIAKKGRTLTVFEYYSDHFMLSELFSPLMNRIKHDLKDYKELGITGILNLIVPIHKKPHDPAEKSSYPWKWVHHMNNYVYARMSWGDSYETIIDEYFIMFGHENEKFKEILFTLETRIAKLTKWNVPLFPARVVDPEKVKEVNHAGQIAKELRQIHEYVSNLDLYLETRNPLHHQAQASFTANEMMLMYIYYVKVFSELYLTEWNSKLS